MKQNKPLFDENGTHSVHVTAAHIARAVVELEQALVSFRAITETPVDVRSKHYIARLHTEIHASKEAMRTLEMQVRLLLADNDL